MFNKIQNPETGNWVDVNGKSGQRVLRNYVTQAGGMAALFNKVANFITGKSSDKEKQVNKVQENTNVPVGLEPRGTNLPIKNSLSIPNRPTPLLSDSPTSGNTKQHTIHNIMPVSELASNQTKKFQIAGGYNKKTRSNKNRRYNY